MKVTGSRAYHAVVMMLWCLPVRQAIAQSTLPKAESDSLWAVWYDESLPDTSRLKAIGRLSYEGYVYSEPDSAFYYAQWQYDLAQRVGVKKQMAYALITQGVSWKERGAYARALDLYSRAGLIYEGLGDKQGLASSHIAMGEVFSTQGLYPKALSHFERGLALDQEVGYERGVAKCVGSIGSIYHAQKKFSAALDHFQRALDVYVAIGDERGKAGVLNNIANCIKSQGDRHEAMRYYKRALVIMEKLGDRVRMANVLSNIGNIYLDLDSFPQALSYYQRSLKLREELASERGIASSMINIGRLYEARNDHRKALNWCGRGLEHASAVGVLLEEKAACKCLYEAHKGLGHGSEALAFHERMLALDDSLQREETVKKLQQMEFAKVLVQDSIAKAEEARVVQEAHAAEVRAKNRTRNILLAGGIGVLLLAGGLWWRLGRTRKEKKRSEEILYNVLPEEVANEIRKTGGAQSREIDQVSILFTDFKGFTELSARISRQELMDELNACFQAFDGIIGRHGVEKIKTIGDSYMAAAGLKGHAIDAAMNTVQAGLEMQAFIEARHTERSAKGLPAFRMRVGIHTGPVVAGIVGVKKFQYDIWGDTVNTASRMESSGEVGQVNISEATYELVKNGTGLTFTARGKVQAKGKGEMEMYFVRSSPIVDQLA